MIRTGRARAAQKALFDALTMSARRAGLSSGMSDEAVGLLDEVMELMPPSNVSIKELMYAGSNRTAQQALLNAEFLRAENIARSADMLKQLHTMPPLLGSHQMVQDLAAVYQMRLTQALGAPRVKTPAEEEAFATNLRESRARDGETRFAFGVALSELYSGDGGISQRDQLQIDWHLDALFSSRVGLRFLVEHYLASRSPRDGWSGIIQLDCSPSAVCEEAASAAKCRWVVPPPPTLPPRACTHPHLARPDAAGRGGYSVARPRLSSTPTPTPSSHSSPSSSRSSWASSLTTRLRGPSDSMSGGQTSSKSSRARDSVGIASLSREIARRDRLYV